MMTSKKGRSRPNRTSHECARYLLLMQLIREEEDDEGHCPPSL